MIFPIVEHRVNITTARRFHASGALLTFALALGLAAGALGAAVDFTTIPAAGFNNTGQLSTAGTLVDAAHFGADAEADVTANGIVFVSRGASSPRLTVGGTAGANYYSTSHYQASSHAAGYTAIAGLSAPDAELMFDSIVYGPGIGNSLVTLGRLTIGHVYRFQLLLVKDDRPGNSTYVSNDPATTYYGPYDWSNNAVQLITGTFTADAATQTFRQYVGGDNNVELSAYQLRDLGTPPLAFSPAALDFGNLPGGAIPHQSAFVISNQGSVDLSVNSLQVTGPDAALFSVGSYPPILALGESASVTITCNPVAAEGYFSASLVLGTDDPVRPVVTVPLSAAVKLANPDANLLVHFTFDNPANVAEDTGTLHNHGTPVGDACRTSHARVGAGALLLDDDGDSVEVASSDALVQQLATSGEGFTVACWAFEPADSGRSAPRMFSDYMIQGWSAGRSGNEPLLGSAYPLLEPSAGGPGVPSCGSWHHFAYVFRNAPLNRVDFFVDGVLADTRSGAVQGFSPLTQVGISIGATGRPFLNQYFRGRIDDLRIYNRELVSANIAEIHQSAPPMPPYEAWVASAGLDPLANGAPAQDPDGDGLTNSVEFLLGSNPASGVPTNLPAVLRGDQTLTVVYRRNKEASGAGYAETVEHGDGLTGWTTAINGQNGVTISVVSVDATSEEVTVVIPTAGQPRHFARLKVTSPSN
ncbi:MAG: hypothetical protein J0M04_06640 [Verrucomicrobia bacterium]|nr:hypothetical protein [Verrucomicrobiota bacterium]